MAGYSSDEDPALRGDLTMDTDFEFEMGERCQQEVPSRAAYLPGPGDAKRRGGKGEGGRAGPKPAKEKSRPPPLDIHQAGLVGGEGVGLPSPPAGPEGRILCRICGDSAVRHVHYGGHCCFSCKAFFRRAVNWQNKNNRNFQCKFESKCEITIKNRKTCQSCRFQKCMTTGMNPSWVLSDEQRKKRFKKYRDGQGPDGEGNELSPASSQDSERDTALGLGLERGEPEYLELGATRRRAKSAPVPVAEAGVQGGVQALQRLVSQPGPSPPSRHPPRLPRLSGPPSLPLGLPVPVIKVEKDHFQMSPLPPDFAIDFNDSNKHFGATEPNIKVEHDIDFGQADFESLEGLIQHYELSQHTPATTSPLQNVAIEDVKPDINKNEKDFSSDTTAVPSIPTGICLQLSEEDMMYIYKLEMSFENSFASIPHMGAETNEIWDFISQSWNFRKVSHSFTSSLLTEAVELCLRRNLIFLQENSDFTSLSIKDRKVLYNNNMGSMCHVRGVMQHTTKHDFLVRGGTTESRVQGQGVIAFHQPPADIFEISYKNHKTGKIRRWNLMDAPFQELPNGVYNQSGDVDSEVYNVYERERRQSNVDCQKKSLLHLAESLWALELERTSYLILLLIVLFSTQGCQIENLKEVDRCQNQYMMLLFRYLQAKHGQEKVHGYLSKIMTFVLNLLTNTY